MGDDLTYTVSIAHPTDPTGLRVAFIKEAAKTRGCQYQIECVQHKRFYWSIAGAERLSAHMGADEISGKTIIVVCPVLESALDIFLVPSRMKET